MDSSRSVFVAEGQIGRVVACHETAFCIVNRFGIAGMASVSTSFDLPDSPVDVIEQIAARNGWSFERDDANEISIAIAGHWCDYRANFTWLDEVEALHLSCSFDLKVPERRRAEVRELIGRLNERLWVGHFDYWSGEHMVMFRHSLLLPGAVQPAQDQCEALLKIAADTCERYFQAFQFVVWAGKSAADALDSAIFETAGEA